MSTSVLNPPSSSLRSLALAAACALALGGTGCVEYEPFSWISAEWIDCERVASVWTEDGSGGFSRRDVPCDEVTSDPGADSELVKACDFEVAKPASCGGGADATGDTESDGDATGGLDDGGSEVAEVVGDEGPEAEVGAEVGAETADDVTPDVTQEVMSEISGEVIEDVELETVADVPAETVAEVVDDVPAETVADATEEVSPDTTGDTDASLDSAPDDGGAEVDAGPLDCAALAPQCQAGVWNEGTGECDFLPVTGSCEDGDVCTENEACEDGQCVGEALNCDDGVACTSDSCGPTGCTNVLTDDCECQENGECDDENPCTEDLCTDQLTCSNTPVADGMACGDPSVDTVVGACYTGECKGVQAIAAGYYHTCAVLPDAQIRCWGNNEFGQLGVGTTLPLGGGEKDMPSPFVANLSDSPVSPALGAKHTCVTLTNGGVSCWGTGSAGQLGAPESPLLTTDSTEASFLDVDDTVSGMDCSASHCCGIVADNIVCWGNGAAGALGTFSTDSIMDEVGENPIPYTLPAGLLPMKVAVGEAFTCVLTTSGVVRCWGFSEDGQTGSGGQDPVMVTGGVPSTVPLQGIATDLTAGPAHACAIVEGNARCWGKGESGRLGSRAEDNRLDGLGSPDYASFVALSGGAGNLTAIEAGNEFTCALQGAGQVRCWGANYFGQLGAGNDTNALDSQAAPGASLVPLPGPATALALGVRHACAIVRGQVICWGDGTEGKLGTGFTETLGDQPNEVPTTFVNTMGATNSQCYYDASCASGNCTLGFCAP